MESFPYDIFEPDEEIIKKYPKLKDVFVSVGPKKYCLFPDYKNMAETFYNFEVRSNDVWIFGLPRSGTTLAQELVWLVGNDLDYEKAAKTVMHARFPVLECRTRVYRMYQKVLNEPEKYSDDLVNSAKQIVQPSWLSSETKERRFIKTHLPFSLGPKDLLKSGCKVFYLARNPKDVAVSLCMVLNAFKFKDMDIEFEEFWEYFKQGFVFFSTPYFEHVKEGWELRNHKNVMFLVYDEYIKDMRKTISQVANFLEKKITPEQIDTLEKHLQIDNFRKNKTVNNDHFRTLGIMKDLDNTFIRKGKVGGWRDYFTEDLNADADKWIEENLKNTDMKFLF